MSFQTKEAAYDPLASDEKRFSQSSDGAEDQEDNMGLLGRVRKTPFRSSFWARAGGKVVAAVNTILLLSIIVILLVSHRYEHQCSESECAAKTSYYSPLFEDPRAIEYEYVRFQGALEHQNVYKGTPNKELDEAWEVLIHTNNSGVDGNVIDRIQKSRIAAKYPKEQGGQYYTGIEVFHHMHCLNLIRQYTYKDYYHRPENRPKPFTDSEPVLRAHVDHCIDMLRQVLMCQADVGIVTYNWVHPWGLYPDFSTEHKCRKFDKIVEWADKHALPDDDPEPDSETVWLSGPPQ
ncbi:hypothetical protein AFCA_009803 [Aspergillus flavus]|uniref:Tat pathway signal sequence n=1 Tax=Aspergillus flavus TaxID=5059 RepID=A0AB74CAJ7_ASPFL|nr:hypothetical protein G4B11_009171 [Aspergillus flavus]RAQ72406.1 hypothetical protein COH20_011517 [Aspergillus flavus]RAQ78217.1 hypothetical protein COH21_008500 [Aspergillus flavus]RMZ42482.1 hypothetical protein CA14_002910 [Aspergillus flavus]UDD62491.1 hypothetical protein AFCA_009803 [Aspergillus flavus]